ncbi:cGMP-dependent 3',5'-cyclic phosphodiesterase-like isoform X4 [Gigantopelta aegis]|uniref:cGMP-dependent 3',5'-cyclic phosphodiesterase-like isoform X4 n=1 Tax=Gigantopelta aegis TaxID=1735272 RepID=UPI001B88CD69|nr:cGMP-dependent 3',5'-cyclic phosphodiesterase-like isoform X4 [Gigantopelta aegis]
MVIVLTHTIVSAFLYMRNSEQFLTHRNCQLLDSSCNQSKHAKEYVEHRDSLPSFFEEAFNPLLEAKTISELRAAISKALLLIFPQQAGNAVYLTNPDTRRIECEEDKTLPTRGILWRAYQEHDQTLYQIPSKEDPIKSALGVTTINQTNQLVLCVPIQERDDNENIGLVVIALPPGASCCPPSAEATIHYLTKQVSLCYQVIKNAFTRRKSICVSDTHFEALIRLCGELYDQDADKLQIKVIKYLEHRTQAQSAFLLLVVPDSLELFCQVVGSKILSHEVRFPGQLSPFSKALETKEPIGWDEISEDHQHMVEELAGIKIKSLLCVPVRRKGSERLVALACVINKKGTIGFTSEDIHGIHQCFQYTATVLTSTLAFQNERKLKDQTQALLHVARKLFTRLDDLTKLLREIMQEARNLTNAERCSVFLIDNETDELVSKVFDGISANDSEVQQEIRMPKMQGIAGHVATTGNLLNITDAYSHPLFYRGIDDSTGFRTRNILTFPIKNEEDVVLGVAQLCNKKTGPYFTVFDEDIASAFAVYCCISISHCLMYKKLQDSQHRSNLSNELMIYHMQVSPSEVEMYCKVDIPSVFDFSPDFDKFYYAPRSLSDSDSLMACMAMFDELGFTSRYRIRKDTLTRFCLMVKKGYRNPPYHNWMHAYAVTHFCYLLIQNIKLEKYLEPIEMFALFVSCMCHDIDHRGTTNSFQVQSQSVLAALYSSEGSVMERHHFAQSMCIVNTEGCNIFENLSSKDYQSVLDLMRDIILATDLAHHLRILKQLQEMAVNGYDQTKPRNKKFLLCLLMTSCDLSDQTKNWDNTKHIASLVYQEFFSQGDMEKNTGKKPLEMMDREKANIPDLQISFLDGIASPVYKVLGQLFDECQVVYQAVLENRRKWEKIRHILTVRPGSTNKHQLSMEEILKIEDVDNEELTQQQINGR